MKGAPPVHDIAFYIGSMRYMDIIEPHNPNRVLRQMGYIQRIPRAPYRAIDADRNRFAHAYMVKYSYDPQFWEDWPGHLESVERRGQKADFPWQADDEYQQWFMRVSHPIAENPNNIWGVVHEDENSLVSSWTLPNFVVFIILVLH